LYNQHTHMVSRLKLTGLTMVLWQNESTSFRQNYTSRK
jgi:hypothetical protein